MVVRLMGIDWVAGLAGGYLATKVTDRAQRALWRATPQPEKAREPDLPEGSSAGAAARQLSQQVDAVPTERQLQLTKRGIHYGLGISWGWTYCLLRRYSGMSAPGAGIATGMILSLVVDEALNPALGITARSRTYPVSAHVRGFLTHIVYGLSVAAAAEALHRLGRYGSQWAEPSNPQRTIRTDRRREV